MPPAGLLQLANSLKQSGLLQPITARPNGGRLEIIAGERRWRAAKKLGWTEIPVLVREATDEQMIELALIENIQREDLNAIDRASAYRQFCDRFSLSAEEVGRRLGEDRTTVTNYLRLLELPRPVRLLVAGGKLGMGHARCIAGVKDEDRQLQLADAVVQNALSVRALEEIIRREKARSSQPQDQGAVATRGPSPHVRDIQKRFEQAVKTKVSIHEGRRAGTGRITIQYYSLDDFERIASQLGVAID
jgi:ParB family chromosome partitioning protein